MRLALTAYRRNEVTERLSAWGAILLVLAAICVLLYAPLRRAPAGSERAALALARQAGAPAR
jgi:hypothetical protein